MSIFPATNPSLSSKLDFEQFCSSLRTARPTLDELIFALRSLVASDLRASDRGRYARIIAQYAKDSLSIVESRQLGNEAWPTEIAMELRRLVPAQDFAPNATKIRREEPVQATKSRELPADENDLLTVLFMGDENEHRTSMEQLRGYGYIVRCENSLKAVQEAFEQERILGLVVGATWWTSTDAQKGPPFAKLRRILALSNLCWIKLVRCSAWDSAEHELPRLCNELNFVNSPRTQLAIESSASLTTAEVTSIKDAAADLLYRNGTLLYDVPITTQEDGVLRAIISRYLREEFPSAHQRESDFDARTLVQRFTRNNKIILISERGTELAFIVKFAHTDAAHDEAGRFRLFRHVNSTSMRFFRHGSVGALVLSPVGETSFAEAQSLETKLAPRDILGRHTTHDECIGAIDAAIHVLERFAAQRKPANDTIYCDYASDETDRFVRQCGSLVVADQKIDLEASYRHALQILRKTPRRKTVQHGDAHPGNILFNRTNAAILIDYGCAGFAPAGYDLSTLWIHVLAANFMAFGNEISLVAMFDALFRGEPFEAVATKWSNELRFAINHQAAYLAHRAISTSMEKHGCTCEEICALTVVILCRELTNDRFQQFAIRCALAAASSMLPERAC